MASVFFVRSPVENKTKISPLVKLFA